MQKNYKRVNQYAWKTPRGKIISNDEYNRRLLKSKKSQLKKSQPKKSKPKNKKVIDQDLEFLLQQLEREFLDEQKPKPRKKKSKSDKQSLSKRTDLSRTYQNELKRNFKIGRSREKVKSFPNKKDKSEFFFSHKKTYTLKNPIDIINREFTPLVSDRIDSIKPDLLNFYNERKIEGVRQKVNVGYQVRIIFTGKDGDVTVIDNGFSYLKPDEIKNAQSLDQTVENLKTAIATRMNEYLEKQGFYGLEIFAFEAEIEKL